MARPDRSLLVRAVAYVLVATVVAGAIGYVREGSLGGSLAFGFAVGVGVALGIVGYELLTGGGS